MKVIPELMSSQSKPGDLRLNFSQCSNKEICKRDGRAKHWLLLGEKLAYEQKKKTL